MRKALIIALAALFWIGCKKEKDDVSRTVKVSTPTVSFAGVTFTGDSTAIDYYFQEGITPDYTVFASFPVGTQLSMTPTAYDSVTGETVPVTILRNGQLNTSQPGLYVYDFQTGRNRNGFGARVRYYVGIYNVNPDLDYSGTYRGVIGSSTDTTEDIDISMLAPAMYLISDPVTDLSQIGAVFVQTTDSTIAIGSQPTELGAQSYGDIIGSNGRIRTTGGDTVISYQLTNPTINADYPASTRFTLIKSHD
jgi:hypothetical protein